MGLSVLQTVSANFAPALRIKTDPLLVIFIIFTDAAYVDRL
jgi:hypothetical protein